MKDTIDQGFRILDVTPNEKWFFIECSPHYQTLIHLGARYTIPVPWQLYAVSPHDRQFAAYFQTEPIKTKEDTLCGAHVPHVYDTGFVCDIALSISSSFYASGLTKEEKALQRINGFWQSNFNGGLYNLRTCPQQVIATWNSVVSSATYYFQWLENQTIEDILQWTWRPCMTLGQIFTNSQDYSTYKHLTYEEICGFYAKYDRNT